MVRLVAVQVVHGHDRVADQLVDLATRFADQRDQPPEVGVQHQRHIGGIVPLRVAREAGEITEQDADVLRSADRVVEIQRAESLLMPFAPRGDGDHRERDPHQDVPLPPRDLPAARERDHDHRLGEQREGQRHEQREGRTATAVQPGVPDRGGRVADHADHGQRDLPAVELIRSQGAVERWKLGERDQCPARHRRQDGASAATRRGRRSGERPVARTRRPRSRRSDRPTRGRRAWRARTRRWVPGERRALRAHGVPGSLRRWCRRSRRARCASRDGAGRRRRPSRRARHTPPRSAGRARSGPGGSPSRRPRTAPAAAGRAARAGRPPPQPPSGVGATPRIRSDSEPRSSPDLRAVRVDSRTPAIRVGAPRRGMANRAGVADAEYRGSLRLQRR